MACTAIMMILLTTFSLMTVEAEYSSICQDTIELSREEFFAPSSLGEINVLHHDNGSFTIIKDNVIHPVQSYDVDNIVRSISNEKLSYFLGRIRDVTINACTHTFVKVTPEEFKKITNSIEQISTYELDNEPIQEIVSQLTPGGYLEITQMSDDSYRIYARARLFGGGAWGATVGFWVGKVLIYGAAYIATKVICGGVGLLCPEAEGFTKYVVGLLSASSIEAGSNAIGLATGIAASVITGPI